MDYFVILDIIGIVAFAINGFLFAQSKKLDLLGALLACVLTALGGGIVRDVLAGRLPFSLTNTYPMLTVVVVFFIGIAVYYSKQEPLGKKLHKKLYAISDSIGLVFFATAGGLVGLETGFNIFGVIATSLATATGGGVIRDAILQELPDLFYKDFYGMVAILIAIALYVLDHQDLVQEITLIVLMGLGLGLRYAVLRLDFHLPKLHR